MDLDHLIKTRDYILLSDLLAANKNVENVNFEESFICFNYCGRKYVGFPPNAKIKTSLFLKGIENGDIFFDHKMFVIFSLESSSICRTMLKQKSYDKIVSHTYGSFDLWAAVLNIVVTENDLGIIIKRTPRSIHYEKEINDFRKHNN